MMNEMFIVAVDVNWVYALLFTEVLLSITEGIYVTLFSSVKLEEIQTYSEVHSYLNA